MSALKHNVGERAGLTAYVHLKGSEPRLVAGDLLAPELRVLLGLGGVKRATVRSGIWFSLLSDYPAMFVRNRAVRQNGYRHHIFLQRDRIIEVAITGEELL